MQWEKKHRIMFLCLSGNGIICTYFSDIWSSQAWNGFQKSTDRLTYVHKNIQKEYLGKFTSLRLWLIVKNPSNF